MDFNQEMYNLCHEIRDRMIATLNKNYPESNSKCNLIKEAIAKHKANMKIPREIIRALEDVDSYVTNVSSSYFTRGC